MTLVAGQRYRQDDERQRQRFDSSLRRFGHRESRKIDFGMLHSGKVPMWLNFF